MNLNEFAISKYYLEFLHSLDDFYGLIGIAASKSASLTAIAGCSLNGQFGYLVHQVNSIFTAEALAIGTAFDELICPSRPFTLFMDSLSVLSALQAVSTASPSVILWSMLNSGALPFSLHISSFVGFQVIAVFL